MVNRLKCSQCICPAVCSCHILCLEDTCSVIIWPAVHPHHLLDCRCLSLQGDDHYITISLHLAQRKAKYIWTTETAHFREYLSVHLSSNSTSHSSWIFKMPALMNFYLLGLLKMPLFQINQYIPESTYILLEMFPIPVYIFHFFNWYYYTFSNSVLLRKKGCTWNFIFPAEVSPTVEGQHIHLHRQPWGLWCGYYIYRISCKWVLGIFVPIF